MRAYYITVVIRYCIGPNECKRDNSPQALEVISRRVNPVTLDLKSSFPHYDVQTSVTSFTTE